MSRKHFDDTAKPFASGFSPASARRRTRRLTHATRCAAPAWLRRLQRRKGTRIAEHLKLVLSVLRQSVELPERRFPPPQGGAGVPQSLGAVRRLVVARFYNRTPSGFAAWGSFCGAHSMTRRGVSGGSLNPGRVNRNFRRHYPWRWSSGSLEDSLFVHNAAR
jgi:hypothetical protein